MEHIKEFNEFIDIINEEDGGGGGAAASGSGDGGGGVAYATNATTGGMGDVVNPVVGETPGVPDGEAGSGDVSIPIGTYTKNSGITGDRYTKMGKAKINKRKKELINSIKSKTNKIKDNVGVSKVMNFQQFAKATT